MRWTERQLAMLREMGVHVPMPPVPAGRDAAAPLGDASMAALSAPPSTPRPAPPDAPSPAPPTTPPASAPPASIARPKGAEPQAAIAAEPAAHDATSSAATVDLTTQDWTQLRASVVACTACRLCEGRTQTVFGTGSAQAQWMVVGEAPGEQEDLQGEPFVGKSGQLLDAMLRAIGLTRRDGPPERQVYIANTIKCRPPNNRNPLPDEMARCEPYLIRQIALLRPRIILAMGRFAVQSLLRSNEPVGRLRGRVHHYQGVPLIVTYHPAYLLRNPEDKARAWDDLCLALETAASVAPPPAA